MKRSYSYAEKQHVLSVLKGLEENPITANLKSTQKLEIASGSDHPPSTATIYRWKKEALTEDEHVARLKRRGRCPKLTDEQNQLLCGFACFLRQSHETVSLQRLRDFCSTHLAVTLSSSAISKRMKEWGFSSQRAMKRESRMVSQKVVDDAIDLVSTVRGYQYPPSRILVMDETGLWSNQVAPYTYHFRNGYAIHLFSFSSFFRFFYIFPSRPLFLSYSVILSLRCVIQLTS